MEEFWKAILDVALKVGSYISGVNSTRATNAANLQIARETNEAQTEIHREDNAFNAAEADKAREFNSIGSQLKRGREAGVSDWFTLGQPSTSAFSASASNMPGLTVPQMQNPFSQIGASPLDLAGSLKNLADAKKAGAETTEIETLLGLKVDQAKENIIRDRLQNELTRLYGADIQEQTLNKIVADVAHLEALAREAHTNADFIFEKKILTQLEHVTERYKAKLTRTQYKLANEDLKTYRERLDAELQVKSSEVGRNKAEASQANANVRFTDEQVKQLMEMHDDIVKLKSYERQGSLADLKEKAATLESRIEVILNSNESLLESQRLDLQKLRYELDQVKFARDTQAITYIFDRLEQINKGVTAWIPLAGYSDSKHEVFLGEDGKSYDRHTTRVRAPLLKP